MRSAAVLMLCAFAVTACRGGDGDAAGTAVAPPPARSTTADGADPQPGRVLVSFVRAAGRGDAKAMWGLLSPETQASFGQTLARFSAGNAHEFEEGVGTLAPAPKVILSRRLDPTWSVAAVAGDRTVEGELEYFTYAAALKSARGGLKLELGGIVASGHRPEPMTEIDERRPELAVNLAAGADIVEALLWLDGSRISARRGADERPFTATLSGRPRRPLAPGRHQVVVFAATRGTAEASAWTFVVKRGT